jgi:PAS domain S-box-containing protein
MDGEIGEIDMSNEKPFDASPGELSKNVQRVSHIAGNTKQPSSLPEDPVDQSWKIYEQILSINEHLVETQRELEESRDLYADLYDFSPIALLTFNTNGIILNANQTGCNLLGFQREVLVGMPFSAFLRKQDTIAFYNYLKRCKSEKKKLTIEFTISLKSENPADLNVRLLTSCTLDYKTRTYTFRSAVSDITEIKEANRSQFLLSALVQSSNDAIFSMDLDERITSWNQGAEKLYGYLKNEILGQKISIIVPDELKEHAEEIYSKIRGGQVVKYFETMRKRKDGTVIPISKSMSPIKNNHGEVIGISAIARDISEHKKAEDALKESNERFKQLVENINSLFFISNPERNQTIYLSPAYEKIFGRKPDEILANPDKWIENVHPDDRKRVAKVIQNSISNGGFNNYEYRTVKPDGEVRWVNVRTFPVANEQGSIYRVAGIVDDVTEERVMARKLKASLIEKDVLMKETHHRVKNNLQVITSLLNLQASYIKDKRMTQVFHECKDRIQAIALIHENLYKSQDLSHIDFKNYVELLCTNLFRTYSTKPKNVSLDLNIDELLISINRAINLGLVFNELISNSLKYAFPENRKGTISIHLNRHDKKLYIVYKDDGVGIPEDIDFKNIDSLGMQLINIFVKQLGGEIELRRTGGTEYTILMDAETEKDL